MVHIKSCLSALIVNLTTLALIMTACHNNDNGSQNIDSHPTNTHTANMQYLQQTARNANLIAKEQTTSLPIQISTSYIDTQDKMYVFTFICNEKILTIDKLDHKSGLKTVLAALIDNPQFLEFIKVLCEENYGIRFITQGSITKKVVINEVPATQIKSMLNTTRQHNHTSTPD